MCVYVVKLTANASDFKKLNGYTHYVQNAEIGRNSERLAHCESEQIKKTQ